MSQAQLLAAVGDVHGRFARLGGWLEELGRAHGRPVDAVLAVGDLETFVEADAPLRKSTKRQGAAEFGPFAAGAARLPAPLYFIGGNNEDFAALHGVPNGGEMAPGITYLGRVGARAIGGLRVGFLSGIFAPSSYELPVAEPTNLDRARRAGHFRKREVEQAKALGELDLLLLHDWPRGLVTRAPKGSTSAVPTPPPFWGSAIAREIIDAVHPPWALCGHQHRAWAATLNPDNSPTRVACLDEAEAPGGAVLWLETDGRQVVRVGWGLGAEPAWERGQPWDRSRVPLP